MFYLDYIDFLKTRSDFDQQVKIVPLKTFPTLSIRIKVDWNSKVDCCILSAEIIDIEFVDCVETGKSVQVFTIAKNIKIESIQEFVIIEKQLCDQRWGDFYLDMLELSEHCKTLQKFVNDSLAHNTMLFYSHVANLQTLSNIFRDYSFSTLLDMYKD